MTTYKIPAENLPRLRADVAKLARRAGRIRAKGFDCVDPALVEGEIITEPPVCDGEPGRVYCMVTVAGTAARISGWSLAATLQHEAAGTILRAVPLVACDLTRYRDAETACDHCHTKRARRDSYVVVSDAGEVKQVGSSCLGDFLNCTTPDALAAYAELLASVGLACEAASGECASASAQDRVVALGEFLAHVVASIRRDGWLSRTKVRASFPPLTATADAAWHWGLFQPKGLPEKYRLRPTAEDKAKGAEVAAWAESYLETLAETSDYEHNLRVVVRGAFVDFRMAGIAASLVTYRERVLGQLAERARMAESEHVGAVGEKLVVVVTVVRLIDVEGTYGMKTIHVMRDRAGNCFTWHASRERLEAGREYRLAGRVVKHDEYRGVKQTRLTRCSEVAEGYDPAAKKRTRKP